MAGFGLGAGSGAQRLAGQHVLLTGVTGFVGEALLHLLLTEVPDVRTSVLVRPKGSITGAVRTAKLLEKPIVGSVLRATDQVARETGVGLFRRFDIMRHWVDGGVLTFPVLLDPDRLHLNDRGYACLAAAVTDAIVAAVNPATD